MRSLICTGRFARKTAGTQLSPGTRPGRYDLALHLSHQAPYY
ncbi:MAG TPA: hypothetical protein PKG54_12075 [Phycisphaerae bacterium]|nr:hypothetical protein [Phycisphaerae bacterium]HOJ55076.1 hypothetical protein [Phycisphaerae bacterium]HOL24918.1 hypothetical protein [Phycisphaerae bacterium]HPP22874.1 hypothetical protein [Phycisphaerae bacterium]HPU33646.1 hypothetical protein [Phycisphaerae bacterium]